MMIESVVNVKLFGRSVLSQRLVVSALRLMKTEERFSIQQLDCKSLVQLARFMGPYVKSSSTPEHLGLEDNQLRFRVKSTFSWSVVSCAAMSSRRCAQLLSDTDPSSWH